MPGSLANSVVSSSMTDNRVSDRKLERQRETSGGFAELFLIHLACAPLRLSHRRQHQVLDHLGVGPTQDTGIDLDTPDLPPTIHGGLDHSPAGRTRDRTLGQLALHLRELH